MNTQLLDYYRSASRQASHRHAVTPPATGRLGPGRQARRCLRAADRTAQARRRWLPAAGHADEAQAEDAPDAAHPGQRRRDPPPWPSPGWKHLDRHAGRQGTQNPALTPRSPCSRHSRTPSRCGWMHQAQRPTAAGRVPPSTTPTRAHWLCCASSPDHNVLVQPVRPRRWHAYTTTLWTVDAAICAACSASAADAVQPAVTQQSDRQPARPRRWSVTSKA